MANQEERKEEKMAEDKANTEPAPILSLEQYRDQLHPYALERLLEFLQEVYKEVPTLHLLNDEDLQIFLSDEERAKFEARFDEIKGWLQKCSKDNDKAILMVYPYHSPFNAMWDVKKLLKKVAERRAERNRQEAEEKERQARQEAERERRVAALKEINPPVHDAEKYLTPEEQQGFLDSIAGAIDAYLGRDKRAESYSPGIWLLSSRAWDYAHWTSVIKQRKEKEARQKRAELAYNQFQKEMNDAIKKLRQELGKEKKPKFAYPPALAKYEPDEWADLELPTEGQIKQWADPYVWKRLPQVLKPFVCYDLTWQVVTLPYAKYELIGVPCLTWCFRLLVLVEVRLRLPEKTFGRDFHGYGYEMKVGAEELGRLYLGPVEWDDRERFTTPVALLSMLATGGLEADGIEVMEHEGTSISFCVQGYDEGFTTIDGRFRQFIMDVTKDKTLAQGLLDRGVIDQLTAQLLEEKVNLPLPKAVSTGITAVADTGDHSVLIAALQALGFTKKEGMEAIEAAPLSTGMCIEEQVAVVLKSKAL